jgi:lysozyme
MKAGSKYLLIIMGLGASYMLYKKLFGRMISNQGLKFLIASEGFKTKAYKDSKGKWTIGVGHLIDLNKERHLLTATLTRAQVEQMLHKDLDRFENAVKQSIKVPISQALTDALIHLAFNIGDTAFKNSTLVKRINAKASQEEIRKAFAMWNADPELWSRRAKEIRLGLTGNYSPKISTIEIAQYMA